MMPKQCIIVGGGKSILKGGNSIWKELENRFTIGINYAYKYFEPTILTYVDVQFQNDNKEYIDSHGLTIARKESGFTKYSNTFLFPSTKVYKAGEPLSKGVYKYWLCGIWALHLAINILKEGEIFLLGYDLKTEIDYRDGKEVLDNNFHGINIEKQRYNYSNNIWKDNKNFKVFETATGIKIYNVNPESNLDVFDKIYYSKFYQKLDNEVINQFALREEIKRKLIEEQI